MRPWDIVISTNNLACIYTQSVCYKNSRISCIFSRRFLKMASTVLYIILIDHFDGVFMEISTFSCSLYMYVGLRDIKLTMHLRLWRLWSYFLYLGNTLFLGSSRGFSWRSQLFLSLNFPSLHSGQFRDQKSLDLHEKPL